ncbi:MAG: carbohydrate ABC transporter permease [Clostridiales bacterium]|jgi:putative aldouronate transport system permease protein|nr:carbohydrate ABC transporter permease [Clostridiales bacterium]
MFVGLKQRAGSGDAVRRRNKIKRFTASDAVLLFILAVFAILILYPFYNALLVSIVPNTVYLRNQSLMIIPPKISLDAYNFTFKSSLIWIGYRNSLLITVFGVIYNMLLTVLCAYPMTKSFPGRKFVRFFIVFTIYFSGGLIPYYLLIKDLHLMDSLAVMVLPTGLNIMFMLIICQYFQSLPSSLEESAKIDGAGDFTVLLRIILPLSLPLLATFTLYYAVDRWNEWYNAMLFVKTVEKWPLQNVLRTIINDIQFMATQNIPGQQRPDVQGDAIKMSSIIVSMVPMMCLYPFLQRYFLSGLTLGAVKE